MGSEHVRPAAHRADTDTLEQRLGPLRDELYAPLAPDERSCCCASRPAVRVVLPPTPQRDHAVGLLMCAHHYHRSITTLAGMGAHVLDLSAD